MTDSQEQWLPIHGFEEAYEVSSHGRVRSLDRVVRFRCGCGHGFIDRRLSGRILSPHVDKAGYPRIVLSNGQSATKLVHQLVCRAFHGPPPSERHEVAHCDGNPGNASAENLRWATSVENKADQVLHGTRLVGLRQNGAKLNMDQVRLIREAKVGEVSAMARRLGISREHATAIRSGKRRTTN